MQIRNLLFPAILIAFWACSKPVTKSAAPTPAATAAANCPAFFYYYNQEKVPLQVFPKFMLVGFREDVTAEARLKSLQVYPEFENLSSQQSTNATNFYIVRLKASTTCAQTLTLIREMQQQPAITFANPAFRSPQFGQDYAWAGLTSEFMVTLQPTATPEAFRQLLTQTQTELADTLGETTFLLRASKTAKGNALEMANYFQEQPFVQLAEPDFFIAAKATSPTERP